MATNFLEVVYWGNADGQKKASQFKEAATLLGIAVDEDNLIRHFTLESADRLECELRRRPQNKLGFAVQLCTMRQTGRLLSENEQPPAAAIKYLAEQLGIDARLYEFYARRVQTRFEHSRHLMDYLSLRMASKEDRRAALIAAIEVATNGDHGLPIAIAVIAELRRIGGLSAPDDAMTPVDRDVALVTEEGNGNVHLRRAIILRLRFRELHGPTRVAVLLAQLRRLLLPFRENLARLDGGLLPVCIALLRRGDQRRIDDLPTHWRMFRLHALRAYRILGRPIHASAPALDHGRNKARPAMIAVERFLVHLSNRPGSQT